MKRICKKYWILFLFLFLFVLYKAYYSFSPSITIVNYKDEELRIYAPQTIVYVENGKIYAGGTPTHWDMKNMVLLKGIVKPKKRGVYKLDMHNLLNKEDKNQFADFMIFEVNWRNSEDEILGAVEYRILEEGSDNGVCSVFVTVRDKDVEVKENTGGLCLRKMSRIID